MAAPDPNASVPTVQTPAAGCLAALAQLGAAFVAGTLASALVSAILSPLSTGLADFVGLLAGIAVFVVALVQIRRAFPGTWAHQPSIHISHWYTMLEGLSASPREFYQQVAAAIEARKIPDLAVRHILTREAGPASAKRLYLEVRRGRLIFHVCGAPFANGFFTSWWLGETGGLASLLALLPFAESLFPWVFRGRTYYETDTALMFQSLTHSAVLEVVDAMTQSKGLRGPVELERKPILRDLFAR